MSAFRAGDDFHDLLRDLRLALAVHLQGEVLDEVGGVLGRVAHRRHAGAVLGRGRLEQRAVDRDLDVGGDEPLEDLLRAGLVLDERVRAVGALLIVVAAGAAPERLLVGVLEDRRVLQRQQRLARDLLGQRRDVAVVEDVDAVDVAVDVGGHQVRGDVARVGVRRAVGEARVLAEHGLPAERQRRHAAAPGGVPHADRPSSSFGGADARAHDLRVERAGQAAVARHEQEPDVSRRCRAPAGSGGSGRSGPPRPPGASSAGSPTRRAAAPRCAARRGAGGRRRPSPSPA